MNIMKLHKLFFFLKKKKLHKAKQEYVFIYKKGNMFLSRAQSIRAHTQIYGMKLHKVETICSWAGPNPAPVCKIAASSSSSRKTLFLLFAQPRVLPSRRAGAAVSPLRLASAHPGNFRVSECRTMRPTYNFIPPTIGTSRLVESFCYPIWI